MYEYIKQSAKVRPTNYASRPIVVQVLHTCTCNCFRAFSWHSNTSLPSPGVLVSTSTPITTALAGLLALTAATHTLLGTRFAGKVDLSRSQPALLSGNEMHGTPRAYAYTRRGVYSGEYGTRTHDALHCTDWRRVTLKGGMKK